MITLVGGPGVPVPGPSGVDPSGPEEPVPDPSGVDPPGADDPAAGPPDPSGAGLSTVEFPLVESPEVGSSGCGSGVAIEVGIVDELVLDGVVVESVGVTVEVVEPGTSGRGQLLEPETYRVFSSTFSLLALRKHPPF